jgi:intracellular multiplication protein IcmD
VSIVKIVKYGLPVIGCFCVLTLLSGAALAQVVQDGSWGGVAATIIKSFTNLAKLITAGSYLGGLAFSIGAIMNFKQHKDNPTQTPIGKPVGYTFIAMSLLFLPSVLAVSGFTMFEGAAKTPGPGGTVFETQGTPPPAGGG